jgi:serine/threonine-protein kinase
MASTVYSVLPPRYASVEALARGGMGEVYRASDTTLGRDVAVKVLSDAYAHDAPLRARFKREALAAARLSNEPHIVTIYDVGEHNGRPYIVMELATGGTIADRLDGAGHDVDESLRWLEQAAAALDAAHRRGVVHRDVKPANLLLTEEGEVRVADFGIASAAGLASVTETGSVLGTLGYLAPEQARGERVGPAADCYGFAVVAYQLLAGRRPFEHATGAAEALAATREEVPPISEQRPGLPRALDAVFTRALAAEPERRYSSCAELVGELRRALAPETGPTRVHTPAAPPVRRSRAPVSRLPLLIALAVLAGAGVLAAVLLTRGDDEPRQAAKPPAAKTVTAQGTTVTVTASTPTTTARAPATTTAPPAVVASSATGSSLNDAGYTRMRAGDYRSALPLLEQAVSRLAGTGSLSEAYASYNLAYTRFALGRCDGVLQLLARSQAVQGHRSEIDDLRRRAQAQC